MNDIRINPVSAYQFDQWGEELQEEFLDFCTGARGVKMTYDSFFKEIYMRNVWKNCYPYCSNRR